MEFADWLNKKYIEYRGDTRSTVSEFAEYIGVRQPVMSGWMKKGGKKPDRNNILKIADKLGPEVYDVLGLPRPAFGVPLEALSPAMREALLAATLELADILASNKINPDSAEGEALTISVMEKHGFKWIDTHKSGQPG